MEKTIISTYCKNNGFKVVSPHPDGICPKYMMEKRYDRTS
jgi:hypothetical protein